MFRSCYICVPSGYASSSVIICVIPPCSIVGSLFLGYTFMTCRWSIVYASGFSRRWDFFRIGETWRDLIRIAESGLSLRFTFLFAYPTYTAHITQLSWPTKFTTVPSASTLVCVRSARMNPFQANICKRHHLLLRCELRGHKCRNQYVSSGGSLTISLLIGFPQSPTSRVTSPPRLSSPSPARSA